MAKFVVSLGPDGRIDSQGSISDVLTKHSELAEQVKHEEEAVELDEDEEAVTEDAANAKGDGKLVVAEEIEEGHVSKASCKTATCSSRRTVIDSILVSI